MVKLQILMARTHISRRLMTVILPGESKGTPAALGRVNPNIIPSASGGAVRRAHPAPLPNSTQHYLDRAGCWRGFREHRPLSSPSVLGCPHPGALAHLTARLGFHALETHMANIKPALGIFFQDRPGHYEFYKRQHQMCEHRECLTERNRQGLNAEH